ncbi:MAG: hypothetical protein DHS20C14_14870 [Phycisphaeraceae bacterium]|nr:MAG: hypothetical protein DHS20C14_14870 [Phycisphaeraceae bacterium]
MGRATRAWRDGVAGVERGREMKGPGGPGEGPIDPEVGAGEPGGRPTVRLDAVREERGEDLEELVGELEAQNEALEARVAGLEDELIEVREALAGTERRHEIERAAVEAEALDAETVALLTEVAVAAMGEPDVRAAVEELRREKPFLFRGGARRARGRSSAMSAAVESSGFGADLGELAEEARASGDRRALLAYLRQRRGA